MIWYPLNVRSQRELETAKDLQDKGFNTFVATQRVITIGKGRRGRTEKRVKTVVVAPSYVFCDEPWHEHKHIFGPVLMGDVLCRIPHAQMANLFAIACADPVEPSSQLAPLEIGQIVNLVGKPYEGVITVKAIQGKRVKVTTRLFGRDCETTVNRDRIIPIAA